MSFSQIFESNTQFWQSLVADPWRILINVVDILLVTWLLYLFIKALSGTKVMTLIRGVIYFILAQVLASFLGLQTLYFLMNQVITYGVIAAVVIFTPEIRAALEKLGRTTKIFTVTNAQTDEEVLIQAFLKATDYMRPRKIGALVSVEGTQTLQEYISTGLPINADVSSELLINIFIPNTPLHDGAVIIQDKKIAVACAYLPLAENPNISKEFGTRHRAAIGLSEHTDAFTFIVSEETGNVSIAHNGIFKHNLSRDEFKAELKQIFSQQAPMRASKFNQLLSFWKGE